MPSRIIKESITTSESLSEVSAEAERLFWRLVVKADDFGLYYGNPRILASMCFPLDPPKEQRIRAWLDELVAAGMVTMGAFLPLQGWMMALDGILIGARDFRYLAITCTLTATVYIALTAICVDAAAPMLPGDLASTVLLWAMFNIVLMGGRGLFNGLRIRGESWLGQTAL